jgi:hypothetical protein
MNEHSPTTFPQRPPDLPERTVASDFSMVIDHSLSISLRLVIRAFIHRFRRQKQFR